MEEREERSGGGRKGRIRGRVAGEKGKVVGEREKIEVQKSLETPFCKNL